MCTAFLETAQHDEKSNHSGEMMMFLLDDNSDMFVEKDKKVKRKNEVLSELKANLQEIKKTEECAFIGRLRDW